MTLWGAVMPTRHNHSTIGSPAVRSALDQTVILERMAVVDPRANRQTYDRPGICDIDVVRWKGPASMSCGTRTWTMSSRIRDTSTMLDDEDTLLPDVPCTLGVAPAGAGIAGVGPRMVPKGHEGIHRHEY